MGIVGGGGKYIVWECEGGGGGRGLGMIGKGWGCG